MTLIYHYRTSIINCAFILHIELLDYILESKQVNQCYLYTV
jgi:hypothetical protein